ncbi:MAG: mechanosensitive ion channel family protein [Candidatus Saccharimonadales bacterium]|nr:mechanosensitive ion channel family protein [Candidatus Saccharimonadales bacterium]
MEDSGFIDWLQTSGIRIAAIIAGAWLFGRFGKMVISRTIRAAIKSDNFATKREEKLREDTLISIISTTLKVLVWLLAVMIILSELKIDIGPLVAGAGVAGIAIGFGAQELIQDFVSGIFIILENQYRVGDVVEFEGTSGQVTEITMRSTVLRDLDGNVHHFPNGMIRHTVNKTMEYSNVNMDIGVAYEADIDKVERVINEVGSALGQDEVWGSDIVEPPTFWRITNFGDSSVDVKIVGKTKPSKQWTVAGEFRRRLKKAFEKEGIDIPYPQRVVHDAKTKKK